MMDALLMNDGVVDHIAENSWSSGHAATIVSQLFVEET